jgi:hypothetical protein
MNPAIMQREISRPATTGRKKFFCLNLLRKPAGFGKISAGKTLPELLQNGHQD